MTESLSPHPKQSRLKQIAIMILITLLLLLSIEAVLRFIIWRPTESLISDITYFDWHYSPYGRGDLQPNQDGLSYQPIPYIVKTNSDGLRNASEVIEGDNVIRVLAIGDSFTYGIYVNNHETWPASLEEILNRERSPDALPIQVLNAGISGYTIADELAYLREKGIALEPDLVILAIYPNDITDYRTSIQFFGRPKADSISLPTETTVFLKNNLALYSLAYAVKFKIDVAHYEKNKTSSTIEEPRHIDILYLSPEDEESRPYYEAYSDDFRETVGFLEDQRIPLLVIVLPEAGQIPLDTYPDSPQGFLKSLAEETSTPFLDLLPPLREAGEIEDLYLLNYDPSLPNPEDDPYWTDDLRLSGDKHNSRYGYRIIAREVAKWLIDEDLLP